MSKPVPDERILPYIKHLDGEGPGVPWISYSHRTLMGCQQRHGEEVVNALVREYFRELRQYTLGEQACPQ